MSILDLLDTFFPLKLNDSFFTLYLSLIHEIFPRRDFFLLNKCLIINRCDYNFPINVTLHWQNFDVYMPWRRFQCRNDFDIMIMKFRLDFFFFFFASNFTHLNFFKLKNIFLSLSPYY